jgi:transcriptional regulator with XRE-family HTH domain
MRWFQAMARAPLPDPTLARVLKQLREDHGMTLEGLAFKSGVSISSLGRIEQGHSSAAWSTVRAIIDALGTTIPQLGKLIEAEERQAT